MGSANEYRDIAQDCLRMAVIAEDERDRPLWVTMAQSWIQLAEHVSRLNLVPEQDAMGGPNDHASAADNRDVDGVGIGSDNGPDWSRTPN
jgi:hypothetical protein